MTRKAAGPTDEAREQAAALYEQAAAHEFNDRFDAAKIAREQADALLGGEKSDDATVQTVSEAQRQVARLTDRNAELEAENAALRAKVGHLESGRAITAESAAVDSAAEEAHRKAIEEAVDADPIPEVSTEQVKAAQGDAHAAARAKPSHR